MRVRITRPAAVGRRTLVPGLVVDLPESDAQRILALGNAVALDAAKAPVTRKRKQTQSADAAA